MKNQYFGDVKDLFKYDIVEWIIQRTPSLDRFTFVTMLTPSDGRSDGNKLKYSGRAGWQNEKLVRYLSDCISTGERNVSQIRKYYRSRGIDINIYGEYDYFEHKTRDQYFAGIDSELLERALIFVDPDNGLEIKHSNERHLLRREVGELFSRMSEDSVLVVFQHFRREKHVLTINKVAADLAEVCGTQPAWICDSEIVLFLLVKKLDCKQALFRVLSDYQRHYPKLRVDIPNQWRDESCREVALRVTLFDIAVTSFLYSNFTDYGNTYIDFCKSIGDRLDLSDRDHRVFLLNWLNKWGCRFDKGQFNVTSRQIAEWNHRYERELPTRGKGLWNYTQAEKDGIGEAYEDLRKRRASIRERNGRRYERPIGPTAASKVLFALRPNAAVAWDEGIRKGLRNGHQRLTYREFLEKVSGDLKTLAAECADNGFTLTSLPGKLKRDRTTPVQLVGEYYWATLTRELDLPDISEVEMWINWGKPSAS